MSRVRSRLLFAVTLAVSVAASGCSPSDQTAPPTRTSTMRTTTTTTVTSTASEAPRPTVAPTVTRTLDIGPYRTRPCDLLKPDQRAALGLPSTPEVLAAQCHWKPAGPNNVVNLDVLVKGNHLGQIYRESNDDSFPGARSKKWGTFEPLEVAGQPAVAVTDSSDRFACTLVVGTSPEDALVVLVIAEDRNADSCPGAVAIAERVVGNLGG